jgi:hypothetical protein
MWRPLWLLVAGTLAGCQAPETEHTADLLQIHERILEAHRDRDAAAWTALEGDTIIVGSRGTVRLSPRAERIEARRRYLRATRFSVYRDVRPPIVRVSDDGSQAWLMANVEIVAYPDSAGATDSTYTIWAWVELYERRDGRWLLVGIVSNERPGPTP